MHNYDFHVHTSCSDGHDDPRQIIGLAQARGLDAIALTDHNVLESAIWCVAYEAHLDGAGLTDCVRAIPGIEVSSCLSIDGVPDVVHLVGLGIDPLDSSLVSLCAALDERRISEQEASISHARSLGYTVRKDAEERIAQSFWGRGALARELVLDGGFDVVDEAYHAVFDSEFLAGSNIRQCVSAESAVEAIHSAGGLCVLAHPLRAELSRGRPVSRQQVVNRVAALVELGVDGIEAYYSAFRLDDCQWLEGLAKARGLLVSVGSDHHDTEKRNRMGGCCGDGLNHGDSATIASALGLM